jgi:hypothetical protein
MSTVFLRHRHIVEWKEARPNSCSLPEPEVCKSLQEKKKNGRLIEIIQVLSTVIPRR